MFGWLKRKRREKLRRRDFPDAWTEILQRNFGHWPALTRDEQEQLRGHIQVFLAQYIFL